MKGRKPPKVRMQCTSNGRSSPERVSQTKNLRAPLPTVEKVEEWDNVLCSACGRPLTRKDPDAVPGRPLEYEHAMAERILEGVSEGIPLVRICALEGMPTRATFLNWVNKDRDGLFDRYDACRKRGLEAWADEIIEISDNANLDVIVTSDGVKMNGEVVARSKLRAENRKWLLSKLDPGRYGERLELNVSGHIQLTRITDEQLNASIVDILLQAGMPDELLELVKPYITVIPLPQRPEKVLLASKRARK
jgi:hypothetical protein